ILTANLDRVNQLIEITQAQFEEGIIKKVDVDQLKVNRTNLSTEIQNLDIGYTQQLSLLKYYMGMPVEQVLKIASMDSDEAKYHLSNQLNLDNNSTLRILQKQEELKNLELQNVKDGYFPTLSAFGSYSWQGQTNSLFSNESSFNSFGTGRWGLSLKVPIFDGFQKKYKAQQLEVAQLQLQHDIRNISNLNRMEFHNALEKLQQSQTLIEQQVQNMRLAEELYGITKLSYQEGVAPLTELLNAETSLKEAQTQYLTATLQKKLAELDHLKTSGELTRMIESAAE
ncbi:MAG: TolC family protein, partial [Saprospiraceae bacterium]|nr:TolC family protein [Saprospiraceae bacterium]